VCDFVCILSVVAIEFLSLASGEELSMRRPLLDYVLHRFKECIDCRHCVSIYSCDPTVDR